MNNKYNKHRKALKAAWTNFKAGRYTNFSESLKSAWAWIKSIKEGVKRFTIIKESEKAVCISAQAVCEITDQVRSWNFWCPKSLLKNNEIPLWFLKNKEEEMNMHFSYIGLLSLELN